jgi:hypothetical protein
MRKLLVLALIPLAWLAACGGGGGSSPSSGGSSPPPPPPPPTQTIATPGPPNVETLTVDAGVVMPTVNTAFVSVTVCPHGSTTNCATITNISVDTGSSGLRLVAGALPTAFIAALPAETDGSGNPYTECEQFAIGSSYGSVKVVDITMPVSGETATDVNMQLIGDANYPTVPADCSGTAQNTVASFGANGILGVGPFPNDCGAACATTPVPEGTYYTCPTPSTCANATASLTQQIPNPVTLFATDNNGVIVELPAVAAGGATSASGSLVFGIGTEGNNALGSATILGANTQSGWINATYNGSVYEHSYLDSGSNATYLVNTGIPVCANNTSAPGFFCPSSTLSQSAVLQGTGAATATADFSIANANDLFNANPTATAVDSLAVPNGDPDSLDLGLTFFYGHNIYTAIEGQSTPGGDGPYFAY